MISKEAADLMSRLRDLDVEVWLESGSLRVDPETALTPDLRAALAAREAELCAMLRELTGAGEPQAAPEIPRVPRDRPLPLSFAQRRLWFLHRLGESASAYNMSLCLALRGRLDVAALQRAFAEVVRRHESLRTTFAVQMGEPVQVIAAPAPFTLPVLDVSGRADPRAAARARAAELARTSFDITRGPLFEAELLLVAPGEHVLCVTLAHIVADGWSAGVLWRELTTLYAADAPLPELAIQYADYASWQQERLRGEVLARLSAYWRRQLEGLPILDLPTDFPRPPAQSFAGARHEFLLERSVASALRSLGAREGCTPFMTLLALFQVQLARYSGQDDIAVGTPVANRDRLETEPLIGLFVNSLVLRTDLSGAPSFRECLRRVAAVAVAAFDHQELPFEQLVVELRPARDLSRNPLFQVMFNLIGDSAQWTPLGEARAEEMVADNATSKFDLTLAIQEAPEGWRATFEYATDLFRPATIARFAAHFRLLVDGVLADPDRSVFAHPMLTDAERALFFAPSPRVPYPDRCLHTLIEEQVARTPDAIAVECDGVVLTYAELNRRANQLAHHLRALGARPERLVGLSVKRSPFMPIGMLGILKSGAAYVPMDPAYPPDRLAFMLQDAGADLFVTEGSVFDHLPAEVVRPILLDRDADAIAQRSAENPELVTDPQSLAHVIYSSGSTGRPKGALIRHRSLVNVFTAFRDRPGIGSDDTLIAVTNVSFDLAGLDMYLPLLAGAKMVIATEAVLADGRRLGALIRESGGTFLDATPSTYRLLVDSGWEGEPRLRCVTGGEMMPRDLAERLAATCRDLWDCYAPCETTIYSTRYRFVPGGPLSVGKALSNTRVYLLDAHGQPVPTGVSGDIHIGGDGVARGYLNRPELTAERFLPDPFGDAPGALMYRTGDLARWLESGDLELLGRADQQIKLRGFRIELGEIEHVLRTHPAVQECAVVTRARGTSGDRQLVGFVVFEPGASATVSELRDVLRQKLPEFMVPAGFAVLDRLPLTPNRKVDRRALLRDEHAFAVGAESHVAPRTEMERLVADIWQRALGVERVGVHDNFFELGGHSLLAMKVVFEIEQAIGGEVMPMDLLVDTLEQFAATCARRAAKGSATEPVPATPARTTEVRPYFFGRSDAQLFAVHHPPRGAAAKDAAVLLCPGYGHEYMAAHGTLRRLADQIASQGFHALRFDFYGCGDSAGDPEDASLARWTDDVVAAAQELREVSGATRVCAVGLRLGATLAALAGAKNGLHTCVLWEPIVRGAEHIAELRELQEDWLRATFVRLRRGFDGGGPQVIGFPLPEKICNEIERLDLTRLAAAPAPRVLLLQNIVGDHLRPLRENLSALGARVVHETLLASPPWLGEHGRTIALAPGEVLRRIVRWLTEACA